MLERARLAVRVPILLRAVSCSLGLSLLVGASCAESHERGNPWADWTTLQLKAKSAPLMRGKVELRLEDDGGGRRLETTTTARFIGVSIARSDTTTLFDAVTGRIKEYSSYSPKKGRRYLFNEHGYSVEKLKPVRGADGNDSWEVRSRKEFDYPANEGRAIPVFDYYGMLIQLRRQRLQALGDEVTLHVATSDGPEAYRIAVSENRTSERTFLDLKTQEKTTLPVREFRLTVSPTDPQAEGGFLNMEGEVEIWVEAETKTLLEIVGKVPKVPGKVKLVLSAMG